MTRTTEHILTAEVGGHYKLGEFDKALDDFKVAINKMPEDPVIHDHLGDTYYKMGKLREAIRHWQESYKRDPKESVRNKLEENNVSND